MKKSNLKLIKKTYSWYSRTDKKAMAISMFVLAIFISVATVFTIHMTTVSEHYRELAMNRIISDSHRAGESVSDSFESRVNTISQLSESLSALNTTDRTVIEELIDVAKDSKNFEKIVTVDASGTVRNSNGSIATNADSRDIIESIDPAKALIVKDNSFHFMTDDSGIIIMAPIKHDGVIGAYVVAVLAYDELFSGSEYVGDINHDALLLDEKGKIIAKYDDKDFQISKNDIGFFDTFEQYVSEQDFVQFSKEYSECINSNTSGSYLAKTGNEDVLYVYTPVDGTEGWATVHCYRDSNIREFISRMLTVSIVSFVITILLMTIAGIVITKHFRGERKKISELEYLDGLTGIINRNAFVTQAREMLEKNRDIPYCIMCLDVVNFRIINETYGHERSDEIIKATAAACREAFGVNEVYGRLTADVFVVLVVDSGDEDERISFIESKVTERAREVFINHSIKVKRGIYAVTDIYEAVDRMIDKANIARKYVDINSSSLRCEYSDSLMAEARKVEEIESSMKEALANGEFRPFLQAKYNMVENRICGAEALIRWIKEDGTMVSPGDFIPVFETNGFVESIDFFMLEEICKYVRQMIDAGKTVYPVSVNQSRYLLNDPNYVNKVKSILLKYSIPVGLIELELTETVFFHERERMIKMMYEMKDINVNLSIDDFGSGYSSFNILNDVPFDVLKIDRAFLSDSVHTEKGKWILKEITEMAHGLGMSVVCEGVETKEQVDLLVSIGCHIAQGFYYARPIPLEEFIEKYNNAKD